MKMKIEITDSSLMSLAQRLIDKEIAVRDNSKAAMDWAIKIVALRAQERVPRRTNSLANSMKLSGSNGTTINRIVSFGNYGAVNPRTFRSTSEYAFIVHEKMNPKNPKAFKYLERALLTDYTQATYINNLTTAISNALSN